ncbi:MAG: ABC transporter ATP-binding protein [Myxococcota bacterium]
MSAALACRGLKKRYRKAVALDGLDLEVPAGAICGLIGPNGAGKTTAMSVFAGFVKPDEGTVDLLGTGPFDPARHRGRVGILPQDAELPPASTPRQLLHVWARLQGMDAGGAARAIAAVLDDVLLADRADARIGTLSHGMRRRLTVASALLGEPELIMLDEPTSGLDPAQARHLRDRIAGLRGRATVLVSSHNLAELETLCDHVVFIDKGRCTRAGPLATVTGRDREVHVRLAPPLPPGREEVVTLRVAEGENVEAATTRLLGELLGEGALIAEVRRGSSLERSFLGGRG